ncbi:hypothetical protein BGZ92_002092 [Podila epicladia]|nr:hypothetical protein BGZ92_002092 [Podila epicladia]
MVSTKGGAHDDDEPLLPLISDSGYSKQQQHTTVSSVKLKEISTSSTQHHHHHHKEDDEIMKSSNITSFIISLAAIYLSHRPSTATHTFGYHRAEVLGALFSIFLIWGLTLLLVMEAYDRVRHPIDIDGKTMSIIAGLGVCVNVV